VTGGIGDGEGVSVVSLIPGGFLVGIFAVTQRPDPGPLLGDTLWKRTFDLLSEPVGDGGVVGGSATERLESQVDSGRVGQLALLLLQFSDDRRISLRIDHDRHIAVVLCCCPNHRGAADIDLLDGILEGRSCGDRLFEGVEVHHQ